MKGPCQCFRRNNLSGKGKPVQYYSSAVRARSILHQEVVRHIENIVQEDSAHAGSSELVTSIEDYGMNFMGSANISFYDDTQFFTANGSEYIATPRNCSWSEARVLWDNPWDEIR